jgi:phosphatidyl-myo-inositol dimannoside synthase
MLALVTDAFGGRGGIAQYNRDFLCALASSGAVSSIRVLPRLAPDPVATPAGVSQEFPRRHRVRYAVAALRTALTKRADLIFCGHLYMAPLGALIARLTRAKLIVQMHGIEVWPRPSRLRRAAVEAADLVLCVSRFTRASVLSWAAMIPERLVVLPNTVAPEFMPGDGSGLRAAWGLQGKRVLLTVGRMDSRERYKGHDRVIAAMPQLVAAGHDVIYLVVGEGDDRRRLEACAREVGVAGRLRFVGSVELPMLITIYRAADLFVMPSTGEGFGIAFLEAMASGTPAVGLAVAGAQDALADGELGTAVTESELAVVLARALESTNRDGDAIARAVRARFGSEAFTIGARAVIDRLAHVPARACPGPDPGWAPVRR